MKFIWIDKEKYLDQLSALKGNYEATDESIDPDVIIYRIKKEKETDQLKNDMRFFERHGFLKLIRSEVELESAEDIIPMTKRVEIIKSEPMYLKIYFSNMDFILSDSDLLTATQFRKCLLRGGHFISITSKEWNEIVRAWLDMAIEIEEETRKDEIIKKALNYLNDCIIYEDIAVSRSTLWHNKEDKKDKDVVYCAIDRIVEIVNVKQRDEECVNARQLRAILSDYIDGNSVVKRSYGHRNSFWRFKIDKTEIDLKKQLYTKEKIEEDRKEENHDSFAEDPNDPYRGLPHRPYPPRSRWKDKDIMK